MQIVQKQHQRFTQRLNCWERSIVPIITHLTMTFFREKKHDHIA